MAWATASRSPLARQYREIGAHRSSVVSTQPSRLENKIVINGNYQSVYGFYLHWGLPKYLGHWPKEGWKLHIAAEVRHAREMAELICPMLIYKGLRHKYVMSLSKMRSGLTGSQLGKFITIYPQNQFQAFQVWDLLEPYLAKFPHYLRTARRPPFDKVLGMSGILTTRYGAFSGETIESDTGGRVKDQRVAGYKPDWIQDPWGSRGAASASAVDWPGKW